MPAPFLELEADALVNSVARVPRRPLLILGLMALACAPIGDGRPSGALDSASQRLVDGDAEGTIEILDDVVARSQDAADLCEAYRLMAKAYLALGDENRALDALTAGRAHEGEGGSFDDWIERLHRRLLSDPQLLTRSPVLTREQAVAVIDRMFLTGTGELDLSAEESVGARIVGIPFDGKPHGRVSVTRAGAYAMAARLLRMLSSTVAPEQAVPGGWQWVEEAPGRAVTGVEALALLRRVELAVLGKVTDNQADE